jgi:dTDP-4-amino-4,6-dideoxygalactose transaminase
MLGNSIDDLAIFSHQPEFDDVIHVGRPNIGDRSKLHQRLDDVLDRCWLTNNGPFVHEFENKVSTYLNVRHCIAMCNGTVALEIATRALNMHGEVIMPSFTFVATAHSLQWQGVTPIFCDIDPNTFTIDPAQVERFITPRTTGIIGVHLWGKPCNIDALEYLATEHNLKLIFDSSHAFGCSHKGEMIGGFGNAETFSFHATKFVNSFEGGAVVTNDDDIAKKIRLMKNFGFTGLDNVIYIGTNGKMSEMSAAMGITSMDMIDEFISINQQNYKTYRDLLENINGIHIRSIDEREKNNFQYVTILVDEAKCQISRDLLMNVLHAENIRVRRYFYPGCHLMEPYRSYYPNTGLLLPNTERIATQVLCLPNGTAVTKETVKIICSIIRHTIEHGAEISRRLSS